MSPRESGPSSRMTRPDLVAAKRRNLPEDTAQVGQDGRAAPALADRVILHQIAGVGL